MNTLQRLWLRLAPSSETEAHKISVEDDAFDPLAVNPTDGPGLTSSVASPWFLNNILFIAMLLMALVGVMLRLSVGYWVILTPIFGLISIAEGWRHFPTRSERIGLAGRIAAIWCALLMCIYLLYSDSIQGVMSLNSLSLAMMTLLALGTFVAGVQARVWKISGVGALLFLAVPGVGWLNQSPLLLTTVVCIIIAVAGSVWWIKRHHPNAPSASPDVAPLDDASPRNS
ncbi:hypothetical protein GGD83_002042 [Rhodoblastus sphagnicola]|uniref:hypothetical protein n=1 Tax=Rhodoblastus sphagnicola TaxID=333368 RepID=UPI00160F197C|nr:hypothetical protein [Rhodoblastus sphagnicola]MBB4198242.1 hypothetical protein [Rhodoblastus sphagnicola]